MLNQFWHKIELLKLQHLAVTLSTSPHPTPKGGWVGVVKSLSLLEKQKLIGGDG